MLTVCQGLVLYVQFNLQNSLMCSMLFFSILSKRKLRLAEATFTDMLSGRPRTEKEGTGSSVVLFPPHHAAF